MRQAQRTVSTHKSSAMSAYDALLVAIQIKAFDDWRLTFHLLDGLKDRIVKNPKGGLARTIIEADSFWATLTFNQKHAILETLSHEICHLYKIPSVGIYNYKSWVNLQKAQAPEMKLSLLDKNAEGFYIYYKQMQIEYPAIVFPQDDYFETHSFYETLETLAHELGHAIIDAQERKMQKTLPERLNTWNDVSLCIEQPYLDLLDTVGFVRFYENRSSHLKSDKEKRYESARKAFDGKNYAEESALHGLWMIWEERCCFAFQYAVCGAIQEALVNVGYTPVSWPKKEA